MGTGQGFPSPTPDFEKCIDLLESMRKPETVAEAERMDSLGILVSGNPFLLADPVLNFDYKFEQCSVIVLVY